MSGSTIKVMAACAFAGAVLGAPLAANAALYTFGCITNNDAGNCAIGSAQLSMDVTSAGGGVQFTFANSGPAASSVEQIFFQDGALNPLLASFAIQNGTLFSLDSSAGNLPGGNSLIPQFSTTFSFSAEPPPSTNGINPGDTLGILFPGASLGTITGQLDAGTLQVGLHVIAFANGGSESFVNTPAVPEPGSLALLGSGLLALGGIGRRRKL